ncbi:rod shape-determining protein MreC [Patescibacteria group bacterium]|nr:rod shape-determining protein MreC [Patescibacteria group bacterium]MBU1728148.1 rod shape-determining protein MreC [Patescibacteria group bacterium]
MNYPLNKKAKKNNLLKIVFGIFILVALIYFRLEIFDGLSYAAHGIFRSVFIFGNNVGEKLSNTSSFFFSKKNLMQENENLKFQLDHISTRTLNYNSILDENNKLKEILGRAETNQMVLAGILSKPNQSPYDTLIIDAGEKEGVMAGQKIFALGNIPIGRVVDVFPSSSKVILFSNPGEKTDVVISGRDIFMQAIGRGGGNFEMILPRDLVLEKGAEIVLPGVTPYVLGIVQSILSDPRDPYQKALLTSPVNIQEIKFVQVEK